MQKIKDIAAVDKEFIEATTELIEKSKIRILYLKRIIAIVEDLSSFLLPKSNSLSSITNQQSCNSPLGSIDMSGSRSQYGLTCSIDHQHLLHSSTLLFDQLQYILTLGTWTRCAIDHRMIQVFFPIHCILQKTYSVIFSFLFN